MAISNNLRNRLVGFAIVASSILIFLPVILSKDVIVKSTPEAVVINQNGAVLNEEGKLTYQSNANFEQALNIHGNNDELALAASNNNNRAPDAFESAKVQSSPTIPNVAHTDNGVEMLDFSRPAPPPEVEILTSAPKAPEPVKSEILTAKKAPKEPEVLVAKKDPPKAVSADKNVIAGTKPSERFVVQVGVFSHKSNALNVVKQLQGAGISVYAVKVSDGRELYRVYGGRSNNKKDLLPLVEKINKLFGTKSAIVPI